MKRPLSAKGPVTAGLVAALYVVLTLPFGQLAFGPIQFRLAELLTLLPFFTPWAIPGVTLGCLLSNMIFSTPWDALFGTLATLLAAWFTARSKHKTVAALWPILFNGLIIGTMLTYMIGTVAWVPWLTMVGEVAASEFVVCGVLGLPFMKIIEKYNLQRIFKS